MQDEEQATTDDQQADPPAAPVPQGPLAQQVAALREDARVAVRDAAQSVKRAEKQLKDDKAKLREAVTLCDQLGIERTTIGEDAGVSSGTISSWIRGEAPEE